MLTDAVVVDRTPGEVETGDGVLTDAVHVDRIPGEVETRDGVLTDAVEMLSRHC